MHRPSGLSSPSARRWWLAVVAACLACLLTNAPASAGLLLTITPSSPNVTQGSTGNALQVNLTVTGSSVNIAGFAVQLSVPSAAGISFTGASSSTTQPYALAGDSLGFGTTFPNNPAQNVINFSDFANSLSHNLPPGTYGLGKVLFNVSTSAPAGPFSVTFDSTATSLTDDEFGTFTVGNGLTATAAQGAILAAPVPEPATVVVLGVGLLSAVWYRRRRT